MDASLGAGALSSPAGKMLRRHCRREIPAGSWQRLLMERKRRLLLKRGRCCCFVGSQISKFVIIVNLLERNAKRETLEFVV